jgi:hypothetical protein
MDAMRTQFTAVTMGRPSAAPMVRVQELPSSDEEAGSEAAVEEEVSAGEEESRKEVSLVGEAPLKAMPSARRHTSMSALTLDL